MDSASNSVSRTSTARLVILQLHVVKLIPSARCDSAREYVDYQTNTAPFIDCAFGDREKMPKGCGVQEDGACAFPEEEGGEDVIPEYCSSWFDGCNTCRVEDGAVTSCTRRACKEKVVLLPSVDVVIVANVPSTD